MRLHDMELIGAKDIPPHRRASWPAGIRAEKVGPHIVLGDGKFYAPFGITPADLLADDWEWFGPEHEIH